VAEHAQQQEVYRQRDRLETARTVAAIINESLGGVAQGQGDDISTIASPTTGNNANMAGVLNERNGQGREGVRVNLDNISQLITRRQNTSAFTTISKKDNTRVNISQMQQITESLGRAEFANMCGVNEVARILEYTNQVVEVTGFANSFQPLKDIPIVKAALAYDHPETGEVIVLILNQALYFGNQLNKILLNPNQLRAYGNIVNDVPKQFGGSSHSITTSEGDLNIP
jgi:hypothetical protein